MASCIELSRQNSFPQPPTDFISTDHQLIEILFTVGYYNLLAMILNTLGVQLEGMYKSNS